MATVFPASQVLRCIQLADSTGEPIGNELFLTYFLQQPDGAMHRTAALSSLRSYSVRQIADAGETEIG